MRFKSLLLFAFLLSVAGVYAAHKEARRAFGKSAGAQIIADISDAAGLGNITDFHEKIDAARRIVHANSVHRIDAEFYAKWGTGALKEDFLRRLKDKAAPPPKMECSARSAMTADILRAAGYDVRQVVVYNVTTNLNSHTFIDILNPATGRWETQDPDFDIYWKNKTTGERAAYAEVVSDFSAFEPCLDTGCGWDLKDSSDRPLTRFRDGYKIVSMIDRKSRQRFSVHAPDIDPNAAYDYKGEKGTFCDLIRKNCRQGFEGAR